MPAARCRTTMCLTPVHVHNVRPDPATDRAGFMTELHDESHYQSATTVEQFAARLAAVRARIAAACARVGRDPGSVRLLPVSKTVAAERVRLAVAAGCTELGENKVQEALEKSIALADLPLRWVIIGHLQRNKAKFVARFASEFQALDSLELAATLQQKLQDENRTLQVLVQVNTSGEASKFGLEPAAVTAFIRALPAFPRLEVRGLMTLAILDGDETRVRRCFQLLRELREQLRVQIHTEGLTGIVMDELSMGMSGDFEIAIEEGATVVRVGQAIFGPRALPDSYYWPEPAAH